MKHVFLINPRAGKGDRAARLQAMALTVKSRRARSSSRLEVKATRSGWRWSE